MGTGWTLGVGANARAREGLCHPRLRGPLDAQLPEPHCVTGGALVMQGWESRLLQLGTCDAMNQGGPPRTALTTTGSFQEQRPCLGWQATHQAVQGHDTLSLQGKWSGPHALPPGGQHLAPTPALKLGSQDTRSERPRDSRQKAARKQHLLGHCAFLQSVTSSQRAGKSQMMTSYGHEGQHTENSFCYGSEHPAPPISWYLACHGNE